SRIVATVSSARIWRGIRRLLSMAWRFRVMAGAVSRRRVSNLRVAHILKAIASQGGSHGHALQALPHPDPPGAGDGLDRRAVALAPPRRRLRLEGVGNLACRSRGPPRVDVPALYAHCTGLRLGL